MSQHPRVAAIQMTSTADLEANLRAARRLVGDAVRQGAGLVVLPEAFASSDSSCTLALGRAEQEKGGPLRTFLSGLAREHGIWLVGGTIPVLGEGARPRAACILYAPDGGEWARYDKIHLFDVDLPDRQGSYRESDRIEPGTRIVTADTPFGVLGLAVCYDLRFPEFFRVQFQRGMRLMVLPSAFTQLTGEAHWHALLRARAIENQCWVVAPNQSGRQSATRESYGGSVILDPWGRVLASAGTGEAVLVAPLDPAVHVEAHGRLPVDAHQRLRVPDQELSRSSDKTSR